MQRGLWIGGLLALGIAATPVYDDYHSHQTAAEYLGTSGPWIPDPLWTLGPVVVALVALVLIARVAAKGGHVWPLAVGFAAVGVLAIAWHTYDVAQYPGDATTFRMVLLPTALVAALVAALALARTHRPEGRAAAETLARVGEARPQP